MGAAASKSIGLVALVDVTIQFACWALAAALQTEKFYDISGSLTYILCVLLSLRRGKAGIRQKVNSSLVIAWAVRLGSFLLWRVIRDGGDGRFDKVKTKPGLFAVYWAIQALWILLTALPVYTLNAKAGSDKLSDAAAEKRSAEQQQQQQQQMALPAPGRVPTSSLGWRDAAGWALWGLGFTLQVVADAQKSRFKGDKANAGKWIDVGLWGLAQHPNYFGEMCMWWGIFLSCSAELRGLELLSGVSPLFVSYLLLRVSGVPLLRKAGLKKWGHLPTYQEYLRRTPLLLPLPRLA